MSKTKKFLEVVSASMGYDGEINQAVLAEVNRRTLSTENHLHIMPCVECKRRHISLTDEQYRIRHLIDPRDMTCDTCLTRELDEMEEAYALAREAESR